MTRPIRPRIVVCSPWAGSIDRNRHYAQDAMRDSLSRGEAPFLSHLLYPQVLEDTIPNERLEGLECEASWVMVAQAIVLYTDLGITPGMLAAVRQWQERYGPDVHIEQRKLEAWA